jgi:uroporphyrinogen-III synthase
MWLAMGEGTARACFRFGNPASICADSRDKDELLKYISNEISKDKILYIPMSNLSTMDFVNELRKIGYNVISWNAYTNSPIEVKNININQEDILLISSPSSAKSWIENGLTVPDNVLCMGNLTKTTIEVLDAFKQSEIRVLDGPTFSKIVEWWGVEMVD